MTFLFSLATTHPAYGSDWSQTSVDRLLIAERIAEYAHRWDRKDAPGVARLFVTDGTIGWVNGEKQEARVINGQENILTYTHNAHTERLAGKQSRHHFSGLVFKELNKKRAVTEHIVLVTHQLPGKRPENVATGYYRIVWNNTKGEWLIAERTLYLDR